MQDKNRKFADIYDFPPLHSLLNEQRGNYGSKDYEREVFSKKDKLELLWFKKFFKLDQILIDRYLGKLENIVFKSQSISGKKAKDLRKIFPSLMRKKENRENFFFQNLRCSSSFAKWFHWMNSKSRIRNRFKLIYSQWIQLRNKFMLDYISYNCAHVINFTKGHSLQSFTGGDLFQESFFGTISGYEQFDYKKGYKFGTYNKPWLFYAQDRAVTKSDKMIRIPCHILDFGDKVNKVTRNKNLSEEEIVKELKCPSEKVKNYIDSQYRFHSTDQKIPTHSHLLSNKEEHSRSFSEITPDDKKLPDQITIDLQRQEFLAMALKGLTKVERLIIDENVLNEKTLDATGRLKTLKISRERVRQIRVATLRKLKKEILRLENNNV